MSSRGEASFARISPRRAAFPEKHGKPGDLKSHSGKVSFPGGRCFVRNGEPRPRGFVWYAAVFRHVPARVLQRRSAFRNADGKTKNRKDGSVMDVGLIVQVAGIGILVGICAQILTKTGRDEQATMVIVAGIVVVLCMLIGEIGKLFDLISTVFGL